ncbi:beta-lactamase domain protein [Burkholderia sp. lig30]|jgi:glyoxylase-like metal-dependent hydrolase (beta-lactamase superfamily II)|uniref:N-acyl homoserine lactonase family protein n=1 Tax=Burkholderia sp. lig30 TaxID=1192124 RepID=UPI0004612BF0|nr:N-acyl homoserine lactonase family protein [Burkholderia sp. lig30]KDB10196.1 beta-lactamase domain protein [Burkholderia sp. lig30]
MNSTTQSDRTVYDVFALRYATHDTRRSGENYLGDDPHDDIAMPLDFYVWVIRGNGRVVLVDTGFDAATAERRGRRYLHSPIALLGELGIAPSDVDTVVISHMHYDHAGNIRAFPDATLRLQEAEMAYCTGRCMCHEVVRRPFEAGDVCAAIERLHAGHVEFTNGDEPIAPGIDVHLIGGHTAGLQAVRVRTARGHVVLASDAAHYWNHVRTGRLFPIVHHVAAMLDGHRTLTRLADGPDHVIPGHDPLVRTRFSHWNGHPDIVALHEKPIVQTENVRDEARLETEGAQ